MRDVVVADLHIHTTASDGQLELDDVIDRAQTAELSAIAITDHDRVHPDMTAPIEQHGHLTVLRGIELKVERDSGHRFDLLGYGVRRTGELTSVLETLQQDRIARARRMRECLERRLDVQLDLDIGPGIGRPHLARAVAAHPDLALDIQTVFDDLIGDGKPCFVPRQVPTYARGAGILRDAATVVALAHPLRYANVDDALAIARDLGAVERWYPYEMAVDPTPLDTAIDRDDLLATGGSDAHDDNIGSTGLDAAAWTSVRRAIGMT